MLDELDKFPEMSNFYIVMDNAPIHDKEVDELIKIEDIEAYIFQSIPLNSIQSSNFWLW
jgi:hypothetical protein